jgi:hypothetical protein
MSSGFSSLSEQISICPEKSLHYFSGRFYRAYSTPLAVAIENGYGDVSNYFINQGARTDIMDVRGFTPLHVAAKRSGKNMVELLLRRGDSPIAADPNQEILLLMEVRALNIDGADQLLRAASDLSMTNMKKQTASHVACQISSMPIVQEMIQAGVMLNAQDIHGNTTLRYATMNNSLDIVECLLTRRADPTLRNAKNKSPFLYASSGVKVFRQYFNSARGMSRSSTSPTSLLRVKLEAIKVHIKVTRYFPNIKSARGFISCLEQTTYSGQCPLNIL